MNTIQQLYDIFKQAAGVSIDSRNIRKNDLFFALKGERDGHLFVKNALERGGCMAVIDKAEYSVAGKTFLVTNTETALQELAAFHRQHFSIPVIALTGSNGKTTTKELICKVLKKKYKVTATQGNLNNHLGVPLTLLSIDEHTEMAVVEMGANHQGEIRFLCGLAHPTHGLITNYGKAHLEGFGGVEGVIKGKSEMYDFLKAHEGLIFVNADDAMQMKKSEGGKRYTFSSQGNDADITLQLLQTEPAIVFSIEGKECECKLYGSYNLTNMAYAISIGKYFNVPADDILHAVSDYTSTNNRSQLVETTKNHIILDAYNANPSSMEAALKDFAALPSSTKIIILGDMFELGDEAANEHLHVAQLALKTDAQKIYLAGNHFNALPLNDSRIIKLATTEDLLGHLSKNSPDGSHILIKGSRGMAMEKILEVL